MVANPSQPSIDLHQQSRSLFSFTCITQIAFYKLINMATGMVLTVAQTLFAALDSSVLKEICSMFGYESDLEELKGTVSTVRAVLLDAEAKQVELSNEAQDWIDKLKYTVYDIDDLLDEFNTTAQQRKHKASGKNRVYQKVRQ